MKTEKEMWGHATLLLPGELFQAGDIRVSKSDYTYYEGIPVPHVGRAVPNPEDTDFLYYRP